MWSFFSASATENGRPHTTPEGSRTVATGGAKRNPWLAIGHHTAPQGQRGLESTALCLLCPAGATQDSTCAHGLRFASPVAKVRGLRAKEDT